MYITQLRELSVGQIHKEMVSTYIHTLRRAERATGREEHTQVFRLRADRQDGGQTDRRTDRQVESV